MTTVAGQVSAWGNGLAVRLTKPMVKAAGFADGMPVRLLAQPGRIVIEVDTAPTLAELLVAFDPARHGGEQMAFAPIGLEAGG